MGHYFKSPIKFGRYNVDESQNVDRDKGRGEEGEEDVSTEKKGMIDAWLDKHRSLYTAATRHAFVVSIRDGSVDLSSFRTWLGQDYLFVRGFAPFVANVLVRVGDTSDMEVVLGGLASLNDEIEWFKGQGSKWDVDFSTVSPQKANQEYRRFLEAMMRSEVKYSVMMTAFWAIEAVYQESFAHCLEDGNKTPAYLTGACNRWGNDGFKQYCSSVKNLAERCLENASEDELSEAEDVLVRVLELEVAFWEMSTGG